MHRSILFLDSECDDTLAPHEQPDFFYDLNLDTVVQAITEGQDEFRLEALFHHPLHTIDAVVYRQKISRDLEDAGLFAGVTAFTEAMATMRPQLALSARLRHATESARLRHATQSDRWFLEAATIYTDAVVALLGDLMAANVASRGLASVRDYLSNYVASEAFVALQGDVREVREALGQVRYRMEVGDVNITASKYEGDADFAADVAACFARLREDDGDVEDIAEVEGADDEEEPEPPRLESLSFFSESILRLVVRIFPETFAALAAFHEAHQDFVDSAVTDFDREVRFYTSYLAYIAPLRAEGLSFSYPIVRESSTRLNAHRSFDIALAHRLLCEGKPIIPNDVVLEGEERLLVITGPNQGGKTTFARMLGQLHYLASLGLPVPGTKVRLRLCDQIFTHFEREEVLADGLGKLEDDLERTRDILKKATPSSMIILNEIFTSTSREDAVFLGAQVLGRIVALGALCVCVTFIDEYAAPAPYTVSMMSTVREDDATRRTFSIVRKPADGLAYAYAIAEAHGLNYDALKARLAS